MAAAGAGHGHGHGHAHSHQVYTLGDGMQFECVQGDGAWGPAPRCEQTGKPLNFVVGQDAQYLCTWQLDAPQYAYLKSLLEAERGWNCRVAMTNDANSFRIPFTLPLWGVVEPRHIHVDNHINFVFHMDQGWIIGAAAYPIRERFEEASETGSIHVHGETRWFRFHGFEPLVPRANLRTYLQGTAVSALIQRNPFLAGVVTMMATCLAIAVLFLIVFRLCLRPRLLRSVDAANAAKAAAGPTTPAVGDSSSQAPAAPAKAAAAVLQ